MTACDKEKENDMHIKSTRSTIGHRYSRPGQTNAKVQSGRERNDCHLKAIARTGLKLQGYGWKTRRVKVRRGLRGAGFDAHHAQIAKQCRSVHGGDKWGLTGGSRVGVGERWYTRRCQ